MAEWLSNMIKICSKCNISKELEEFSIQKNCSQGRHSTCKVCRNAAYSVRYKAGIAKPSPYTYSKQLKRYKLTQDDYDKMYHDQDGKCLICEEKDRLVVDHCHITLKVRGLLCTACNTALGKFKDSSVLLNRAVEYLNKESLSTRVDNVC